MKNIGFILLFLFLGCASVQNKTTEEQNINNTLDLWHKAAAEANFDNYFDTLTDDAVYTGTDATEHWDKTSFAAFAKPYFDRGKAWSFKPLQRHIYFSTDGKTAWFDELLDTQMKICRGSGVVVLQNGVWKIKQYVLSMTIPNDNTSEVVKIKTPIENKIIENLNKK